MKTLVFGNLFKLFRLAMTFAWEVYYPLGIKMKTNMTIVLFFSLGTLRSNDATATRKSLKK